MVTMLVSAAVVYFIGDRLDNPDAAILAVIVPSTVTRFGGSDPISGRLVVVSALGVPVLALIAIGVGTMVTGDAYDFGMPSNGLTGLLP